MKKITKKNPKNSNLATNKFVTNPLVSQDLLPKAFTQKAVELYERQIDIKNFTDLVLQGDVTEEFLNNIQAELMLKDVFNPFSDESYKNLAQNERLLNDLASDTDNG